MLQRRGAQHLLAVLPSAAESGRRVLLIEFLPPGPQGNLSEGGSCVWLEVPTDSGRRDVADAGEAGSGEARKDSGAGATDPALRVGRTRCSG
jgi:hypothetical protein